MKVKDLIKELQKLNPEQRIMILDGFNGGGYPRTINLGPTKHRITKEDVDACADCENIFGTTVNVMGYGFY
jgi:hypothetical protein